MANEKRLINVNPAYIQHVLAKVPYYADEIWKFTAMTERFPTVDAVEVVHGSWIPVTERLPEEDVRVLVWLGTGDITYTQIDTDRLHKKKWRRWTKNVTHWMPLPEPPAIDK